MRENKIKKFPAVQVFVVVAVLSVTLDIICFSVFR